MKQSIPYITNLKFFAVILVILGHAIQYTYTPNFDDVPLFRWIYAFHMPLFIFISGFLLNFSRKENFILNRYKSLFIPFFCWAIFYCFFYYQSSSLSLLQFIQQFFLGVIKSPDNGGLWFLWILFICNLIYYIFSKTKYKFLFYTSALFLLNLIYIIPQTHILGLSLLRWYFLFFIFGLYLGERYFNIITFEYFILLTSAVLSVFFAYKFKRNGAITNLHGKDYFIQMLQNLFAAISLIVFFFISFKLFLNKTFARIKWVADQSLGFYAVQFIFFYYNKALFLKLTSNLIVITCLSFFTTFTLCCLLILCIRKIPFLKKILLGQY